LYRLHATLHDSRVAAPSKINNVTPLWQLIFRIVKGTQELDNFIIFLRKSNLPRLKNKQDSKNFDFLFDFTQIFEVFVYLTLS
jgi:5-methylcytosine-specific restriction endonuclease McrBC regulatory subunit McrC